MLITPAQKSNAAGAPANVSFAFLGSHPQLAEDLCKVLFKQLKST